jgi:hypothetical protein
MENLLENFVEYDPDEDMNGEKGGSWGIQIADAIFRTCNYNLNRLKGWTFYRDYKQAKKD